MSLEELAWESYYGALPAKTECGLNRIVNKSIFKETVAVDKRDLLVLLETYKLCNSQDIYTNWNRLYAILDEWSERYK